MLMYYIEKKWWGQVGRESKNIKKRVYKKREVSK